MNESLLHSAFRYKDIDLLERLRQRPNFEQNLLEKNDEGKTCLDLAFELQSCLGFLPPELVIPKLHGSQLIDYLRSNNSNRTWNHLAKYCDKDSFEQMIGAATRSGLYQNVPHEFLLQIPSQHRYAALQLIETGHLDSLPPELAKLDLWMKTDGLDSLYHAASYKKVLHELPQPLLTREGLMLKNSEGQTPIHLLAKSGPGNALRTLFKKITWHYDWLTTDNSGNTVLHVAAGSCLLTFLPEESLSEATMSAKRHDGFTPVDIAYKHKAFHTVPERYQHLCFTKALDDMVKSAESGDWSWFDDHLECVDFALDQIGKRQHRSNFLHVAALSRKLGLIPEKLIRNEILRITDSDGNSPLHLAASLGYLHYLPPKFLDPELFKLENANRENVADICFRKGYFTKIDSHLRRISWQYRKNYLITHIKEKNTLDTSQFEACDLAESPRPHSNHGTFSHWIAAEGQLGSLPDDYLLFVAQTRTDVDGNSPLHVAALNACLNLVPQTLINPPALEARNHRGLNVVDLAFECGNIFDLDPALRCLSPLYRKSCLTDWIVGRTHHDNPHFETADIIDSPHPNSDYHTFAHWVAAEGLLVKLPPESIDETVLGVADANGITPLHLLAARDEIQGLSNKAHLNQLLTKSDKSGNTPIHVAALHGTLHLLPLKLLKECDFEVADGMGRTPIHVAAEADNLAQIPDAFFSNELLCLRNKNGETPLHLVARHANLGGISISWFTKEILLTKNHSGTSVADIIEESGNTPLLPAFLRKLSRAGALRRLDDFFNNDFIAAPGLYAREFAEVIPLEEFQLLRRGFVLKWFKKFPDSALDEEQVEAVVEYGQHIQVTARAGSGKTRTLVARALFQITHCRIPPSSILILAFNKKAVGEIRERLAKYLSEEKMPHVLTFHALAYRIVRPSEDLIFDEGETKESQVFSTTIQRILDEELRNGPFEAKLRELMEARWNADLERIITLGFNLPEKEFLKHRANLARTTMNGRRVDTEAHKHIGNALLRLGLRYSYRRGIHRFAGETYAPDFSHFHKETDQRFLIEVLGEDAAQPNDVRQAFWNSARSANAHLLQFKETDCLDPVVILERVARELDVRGFSVSPMSDDELWLALRDDAIRDFTKTVRGFISRCQKELISPDRLDGKLPDSDPELWSFIRIGPKIIRVPNVWGLQVRFWRLCCGIYKRYRQVLAESHQTDFDQLMLDAAGLIREGNTGFKSARGSGDIRQIRHFLIDEYQDFSHLFDELRKSIIAQSPDASFFCVGDDWQAINKFAGSDLRYFTCFTETFEPSLRKLITRNYRSCRRIVEIGNRVMQGEGEPSVPNSNEQGNTWRVEVGDYGNLSEAEEIVVEELGDDALSILRIASDCTSRGESVAILSRTSSVATPEGMHKLERWQERLRSFLPEKNRELLEVSTTHGYKGKEADVVILLDPEAYPFVHPDAIFNTIFGDTFQSVQDDEKRLFYVGVTRPKKTLYLLSYPSRYSGERPYRIWFLADAYPPHFDINRLQSNLLCGGRVVVRLTNRPGTYGNGGTFPIKDQLKALEFKWNEDRKIWSIFLERGSINSPFECVRYLNRQPWIRNADGIVASFAWEDQKHRMQILGGRVMLEGPADQMAEDDRFERLQPVSVPKKNVANVPPPARPPTAPKSSIHPPDAVVVAMGVFETNVAGMRYEGRMEKASHLAIGNFVRLEREPGNTHDRNAIKVVTAEGVQIGYLSRHVAAHLAAGLDAWGGSSQAKVTSVWKQPPPHFLVSVQICFPLPPGVVIPRELGANIHAEDSPLYSPKPKPREHGIPELAPAAPIATAEPMPAKQELHPPCDSAVGTQQPDHEVCSQFEGLSSTQRADLDNLLEPGLGPLIAELYLTGCSDWPKIGYEGLDFDRRCTGSMLEVAWLDFKIGIALASNDVGSFETSGWTILPAATVTVALLRRLFSPANDPSPPTGMTHPVQTTRPPPTKLPANDPGTTETDHCYQQGPFMDDEPDDDIPF
jgi:DNA helicase IV